MAIKSYYSENYGSEFKGMQEGHSVSEGPAFDARVAVVKISNLEEAVSQVMSLNKTANTGANVVTDMYSIVESLKDAWKGSDAAVHINNIMGIKSWLANLAVSSLEVSTQAHRELHRMNEKQIANGGKDIGIPSITYTSFGDSLKNNELAVDTGEVFVDTEMARELSKKLKETYELYNEFVNQYFQVVSFMFEIWQSGGYRDDIEKNTNSLKERNGEFKQAFEAAIQALDQAIANWEA